MLPCAKQPAARSSILRFRLPSLCETSVLLLGTSVLGCVPPICSVNGAEHPPAVSPRSALLLRASWPVRKISLPIVHVCHGIPEIGKMPYTLLSFQGKGNAGVRRLRGGAALVQGWW